MVDISDIQTVHFRPYARIQGKKCDASTSPSLHPESMQKLTIYVKRDVVSDLSQHQLGYFVSHERGSNVEPVFDTMKSFPKANFKSGNFTS